MHGSFHGANAQNWSRVTNYICSLSAPNLVSALDHVSTVAKRHVSDFQFWTRAKQFALCIGSHQKDPSKGLFMEPMPRIELGTYALPWRCSTI